MVDEPTSGPALLQQGKLDLIEVLAQHGSVASLAELGGIWGVEGGYADAARQATGASRAVVVDTETPGPAFHSRTPPLGFIQGDFADPQVAAQVGHVDAILLFDVLLHQASPDWDDVIGLYARQTDWFVVANPQTTTDRKPVRLPDLGLPGYFARVPHAPSHPTYAAWVAAPNEVYAPLGRPWRDIHHVWQWGITDEALIECMQEHGFHMIHRVDWGSFGGAQGFAHRGFVFRRSVQEARPSDLRAASLP